MEHRHLVARKRASTRALTLALSAIFVGGCIASCGVADQESEGLGRARSATATHPFDTDHDGQHTPEEADQRWPDNTVHYFIGQMAQTGDKQQILNSFADYEFFTSLKFVPVPTQFCSISDVTCCQHTAGKCCVDSQQGCFEAPDAPADEDYIYYAACGETNGLNETFAAKRLYDESGFPIDGPESSVPWRQVYPCLNHVYPFIRPPIPGRHNDTFILFSDHAVPFPALPGLPIARSPNQASQTPLHETGHALGLPHEAKRSDLEDAPGGMMFNPCCVRDGTESYTPDEGLVMLSPYDLLSIMQYGSESACKKDNAGDCRCAPMLLTTPVEGLPGLDGDTELTPKSYTGISDICPPLDEMHGLAFDTVGTLSEEDVNGLMQMYPPTLGNVQQDDSFGQHLLSVDLDNDGYVDLAVSAPGETFGGVKSGAVMLYKGTFNGLVPWRLLEPSALSNGNNSDARFGGSLAAADLNGDGYPELAIGAPGQKVASAAGGLLVDSGAVYVLDGSIRGPVRSEGELVTATSLGISGGSAVNDEFGAALAGGRFLLTPGFAIGAPGRFGGAGRVYITSGSPLQKSNTAYGASSNDGDHFGASLTAGNLDSDTFTDLVAGAPDADTGKVTFILGGTPHMVSGGSATGVVSGSSNGDKFGFVAAIGSFANPQNTNQVVVGAPFRHSGQGSVDLLRTSCTSTELHGVEPPGGPSLDGHRCDGAEQRALRRLARRLSSSRRHCGTGCR